MVVVVVVVVMVVMVVLVVLHGARAQYRALVSCSSSFQTCYVLRGADVTPGTTWRSRSPYFITPGDRAPTPIPLGNGQLGT